MTFEFGRSEEGDLLVCRIGGERPATGNETVAQLWEFFADVSRDCRRLGISRLLVLSDARGAALSDGVLSFYRRLDDVGLDPAIRIAVSVTDNAARRITELGAAVARTRGWDIKLFGDEKSAREWV